jgi:hypothetical protein
MLTYFGKGPRGGDISAQGLGSLQAVRGYWQALRVAGSIPRRDQVDPRGLADQLEKVFLIERIAKGHARFRLAGMELGDLLGMDLRGMPLSALFTPDARPRLADELEQAFTGPSILELWLEAERGTGRPALDARMMVLPLLGDQGEPALALGCLVTHGNVGRVPRRFAISRMVRELLAVPVATVDVAEVPPRPVPHLRLVSSRD